MVAGIFKGNLVEGYGIHWKTLRPFNQRVSTWLIATAVLLVPLSVPIAANANVPVCLSADSDPDNDGWGWENNDTCTVDGSDVVRSVNSDIN